MLACGDIPYTQQSLETLTKCTNLVATLRSRCRIQLGSLKPALHPSVFP